MTSVLNVDSIAAKDGTSPVELTKQEAAKAWVNFNGTGTIAARDSLNLSSLSDGGTGDFTVNFSSAFNNSNYSAVANGSESTGGTGELSNRNVIVRTLTTTNFKLYNYSGSMKDYILNYVATHGDLA